MQITVEEMKNMEFRKERLLHKTKKLEFLLSGRNRSLLPEIQTKAGRHSEKRTWQFIERLIESLEKYEKCSACDEDDMDMLVEEIDYVIPEEKKCFYRSFLYCVVRIAEEDPWWIWITRGTFDDVLKLVERTQYYDTKYELYFYEMYKTPNIDGFFYCMDEIYRLFTGKRITSTICEEDTEEVKKRYAFEIEMMDMWRDADYEEAYQETFAGMSEEEIRQLEWESLSSQEKRSALKEAEEIKKTEKAKKEWVKGFSDKKMFCEQYELCRKLYFKEVTTPQQLALKIERMMDVYLYEQGDSRFMEDEVFFYTYTLLDKTVKRAEELLAEEV